MDGENVNPAQISSATHCLIVVDSSATTHDECKALNILMRCIESYIEPKKQIDRIAPNVFLMPVESALLSLGGILWNADEQNVKLRVLFFENARWIEVSNARQE